MILYLFSTHVLKVFLNNMCLNVGTNTTWWNSIFFIFLDFNSLLGPFTFTISKIIEKTRNNTSGLIQPRLVSFPVVLSLVLNVNWIRLMLSVYKIIYFLDLLAQTASPTNIYPDLEIFINPFRLSYPGNWVTTILDFSPRNSPILPLVEYNLVHQLWTHICIS